MNALTEVLFGDTRNYHGSVDERFIDLAEQFSRLQDARTEQGGAALVVYFQGQKVVDNARAQRMLNGASDRLHQQMVDQQYNLGQ